MKLLKNKYDKKDITNLPRVTFPGKIHIILNEHDAQSAVRFLLTRPVLGIDTETRPCFKKGRRHKVALLQVSTHDTCFLFRLNHLGMTDSIRTLLEDCSVPKIGLSVHDDLRVLSHRGEFTPGNFIDIQKEVKQLGIEDLSLQKLYANIFGLKIAKNQQLSNWESDCLTKAQQLYAATDAWTCIQLHEEINRLVQTKDYKLEIVPESPLQTIPKTEESTPNNEVSSN